MRFFQSTKPYVDAVEKDIESMLSPAPEKVYGMLLPFIKRGGKRVRPLLTMLCCRALGGDEKKAVRPAAIIELFHNFTLIHDDIEDDSQMRRGVPTLHITYGVPVALNSGDALYTLLWKELLSTDAGSESSQLSLLRLYASAFQGVVDGQGMELSWYVDKRFDVSEKEYFEMIHGKTAVLIGHSCEVGAFIAGASEEKRRIFREFGEKLGLAFQIYDDILNVTGEFEKYKKEIGGDISEGKRSLMVVHCLKRLNPEEKKRVVGILSSHTRDQGEIDYVIGLLKEKGSVDYATQKAKKLVDEAKALLSQMDDSEHRKMLLELCDYVVTRES